MKNITNLINNSQIGEAINTLSRGLKPQNTSLDNEVLLIKSQYSDLEKHNRRGLISFEEYQKHKSKITKAIIDIASEDYVTPPIQATLKSKREKIKRSLSIKKKLQKDLLLKPNQYDWKYIRCKPSYKFKYRKLYIRSIDDESWPNPAEVTEHGISTWLKLEIYDFYENGLELIEERGKVIFDKDGFWDILEGLDDDRKNNSNYKLATCFTFFRIPYDFIVNYEMETSYADYPLLYVEYAKKGMPYEEVVYGQMGCYNESTPSKSRLTYYFDSNKRKKLK